ncbi:MAG TPA: glycosyltransferase family 2 protein [Mucilaginibacter sp.]|jgi:glycosyltransferase involved in cell wall biosynthesis|nr:glycosyltransferase family 2 protein [Mucilaginibacter sp.]
MNQPLVSIALCTYNGSEYLKEQLDTLDGQTYKNLELVIVDDGSSDGTIELLRQFAQNSSLNIKIYINDENLGYIKNFEKAISLCNGDYIALCDQDDVWDERKIETLVKHIGDNLLIYHDSALINETGDPLGQKISNLRNCYSGTDSRVFLFENCVSGHAILFKKELLTFIDGFNKTIIHDWWLAYAAANNGSIFFLDQELVQYRQHSNANTNILRQKRDQNIKPDSLEKIERQLNIVKLFAEYPFNTDKAFKNKLAQLMERRIHSYVCVSLPWFMFRHRKLLLYIQKKSALSKLNFILKFTFGYKLKRLLKAQ